MPPEALQRSTNVPFDSSLPIKFDRLAMQFEYGYGVFGPSVEHRKLETIRPSLRNPHCTGPDPVYAIAMDVGRTQDIDELQRRMLLFGVVMYAAGRLGNEPVRSQGHVHAISPHSGWSAPELFEIWEGRAIIYGQENSGDDPGRCIAIEAGPGDKVVMPPKWAHFVANADADSTLIFGAWCDRQYGFDYAQMRAHHGLAWYPLLDAAGRISWEANPTYSRSQLRLKKARSYPELGLSKATPIYALLQVDPEAIEWVSDPAIASRVWACFEP